MKSILGSTWSSRPPTSAAAAASATSTSSPPTCAHLRRCAEAAAGAPIDRAVLGRPVFFVDDDPERDAQAERGAAPRRAARRLSRGRVPVRADRRRLRLRAGGDARGEGARRRHRRRHLRLLDRAGRPRARRRRPTARATSSPTTACTSPAPTSTAGSSWRAILPLFGYGALRRRQRRRRAAARGAERGLLRPRHLAPDQHRLQPAARRRAARHALVLRRPGAAPAADDASSTERLGHELLARAESAKIAVADGGTAAIDLDPVEAGLARELRRGRRAAGARRRPRADRRRGARDRRAGRPRRRRDRRALLHRRLDRPAPARRAAAAAFPAARPVRGDRFASVATGLALHAARRFAGAGALTRADALERRQPSSTAAIASAGRLDVAACSGRRRRSGPSAPGRPRTPRAAGRPARRSGRCS